MYQIFLDPVFSFLLPFWRTDSMTYETRRFNAAFKRTLPWTESTQFLVLIPIYLRSILILPSHRLGLPKGIFPAGVPVKILKAFILLSILATWPAHLSIIDLIILTIPTPLGGKRPHLRWWMVAQSSSTVYSWGLPEFSSAVR